MIGGAEPILVASNQGTTTTIYTVRQPVLQFADVDAPHPAQARVAGARVVESSANDLVVRDFASGRAWRLAGAPGHVVTDATGSTIATFDGRTVRLWTIAGPRAATAGGGILVKAIDRWFVLSALGRRAPLRAFDAAGSLVDEIRDPDTRFASSFNRAVVWRGGKSLLWDLDRRELRVIADRELTGVIGRGDELYANDDGTLIRLRDRTTVCPRPAVRTLLDGSVVVGLVLGQPVVVCHLVDGSVVELPMVAGPSDEHAWVLSRDGRRAAVLQRGRVSMFDTRSAQRLALPPELERLSIRSVGLGTDDQIAVVAKEGLFVFERGKVSQLASTDTHKVVHFGDDNVTLVTLSKSRVIAWDLRDHRAHELGMLAGKEDAKNDLVLVGGRAVAASLHARTGVAVSFSLEPPSTAEVDAWLARVR